MAKTQATLKLGPFSMGLNNVSDPSAIDDKELSVCQNFDFDVNGTPTSRPPIQAESSVGPVVATNIDILGFYTSPAGAVYVLGATTNALYYRSGATWTLITSGLKPVTLTQYLDKVWVVVDPTSGANGGSWSFSAGWSTVASMPKGGAITVFKERLWITGGKNDSVNGSRLYFSAIADGTTWNGSDFIDVSKGDGQSLIDLYSLSTNLYLFKNNSTYVLQYDSAPGKGVVNKISNTIGVYDTRCIVQYENVLYIFHGGYLYEMVNYVYNKTNLKVNILRNASGATFNTATVSLVGSRVIVQYLNNYFIFYLFTRSWSQWNPPPVARFWPVPNTNPQQYIMNSNSVGSNVTYDFFSEYITGRSEAGTVYAKMETKVFDFDAPNLFKKLYWWGADVTASGTMQAWIIPVRYNVSATWNDVASLTWDQILLNTWDRVQDIDNSITEIVVSSGAQRKFYKFLKTVRFRNVYFRLWFTISDWVNPTCVFSLTPVVSMKELVPKTVN
jgi:hypothetical protein